jgi:hypothetical protein
VDIDFEEWLESPAPDRERQIHTVTRLHHEALNRMAISERIAYTRTTLVATCKRYRRLPKEFDTPIFHNNLRGPSRIVCSNATLATASLAVAITDDRVPYACKEQPSQNRTLTPP